jgi:lactoylglutathione lyase
MQKVRPCGGVSLNRAERRRACRFQGTDCMTKNPTIQDKAPLPNGMPPKRLLHTMLRIGNLQRSLKFYTEQLGMRVLRREDYPSGRFTLAFVGYDDEHAGAVLELTHNWDTPTYEQGSAFGHIALAVTDIEATCARLAAGGVSIVRAPGPMSALASGRRQSEIIAFIEDPDGYRIELIETTHTLL